jgi:putative two-component system response regulator
MMKDIGRKRVLVVDDTPANIRMMMDTLRDEYAVVAALDGKKALSLAGSDNAPDIILLDVLMPGMDGYEVCRMLKSDKGTKDIPVIFVTSSDDEDDEQKGLSLGAVDYIHKPFKPLLLKSRVRNHIMHKLYRDHLEDIVNRRTRELIMTRDAIIYGLATLAEYRDIETGRHIKRTQFYVRHLAEAMKSLPKYADFFTEDTVCLISKSAQLHDIGKVGIPDRILFKPDKLTDDEAQVMKNHVEIGRDSILKIEMEMAGYVSSDFLKYAGEIAFTHHEKTDGSGYLGLAGDDIPVSGRLMALADVYDALTSRRTYKHAFTHEQAVRVILEGDDHTGPQHFDPDVLSAFMMTEEKFRKTAIDYADSPVDTIKMPTIQSSENIVRLFQS